MVLWMVCKELSHAPLAQCRLLLHGISVQHGSRSSSSSGLALMSGAQTQNVHIRVWLKCCMIKHLGACVFVSCRDLYCHIRECGCFYCNFRSDQGSSNLGPEDG